MAIIEVSHLTKDFGNGKGVFDVSIQINEGEIYGFLGPNGAGKSTTIRHLMGFYKPQTGTVQIFGLDCLKDRQDIQKRLGYIPGEIAFPNDMTGKGFLMLIAELRKMKNLSYMRELLERFEIDPSADLKRMSKGMKQKIGIVAAFMHRPKVLLLDEPTSGLDPLMKNRLLELAVAAAKDGSAVLMSSHDFDEVDKTSNRIGIIKEGKLIEEIRADDLRHSRFKTYKVEFSNPESFAQALAVYPDAKADRGRLQASFSVTDSSINELIHVLAECDLRYLKEEKHTLEEYFMQFYGRQEK